MKLQEVTSYNLKSATILNEGWQDLTESQRIYVGRWEKELWPLLEEYTRLAEATLTATQIQDIFKGAEAQANASGDNRNLLGKAGAAAGAVAKLPVDVAKKVDAKINELGRMAQNAGPVKNADAKFEQLKKDITAKNTDSKVVQGIQKISDWAKENPGKASLAVGILTTIAAFAGGPLGGAAAGLILRSTKDLLQGEKLSTAVGKSVKTAAYGALAGLAIQGLTDGMVDNIATGSEAEADAMLKGFENANFEAAVDGAVADAGFDAGVLDGARNLKMSGNINGFFYNYDLTMTADQVAQYKELTNAYYAADTFSPEYYEAAGKLHGFLSTTQQANADLTALARTIADIPKDALTGDQIDAAIAVLDNADKAIETLSGAGGAIGAAAQGALATVDDSNKEMHKIKPIDPKEKEQLELDLKGGGEAKAESIDMEDRFEMFLMEKDPAQGELPLDNPNTLGAKAKRGLGNLASKVGGAVKGAAGKVKAGAKELGSAVSAKKLTKQWKAAGEPMDTASIMNILQDNGMTNDQIATIGQEAKVDLSKASAKAPADKKPQAGTPTPASEPASDTPASEPASDTPASEPASDTPASEPASDTPASDTPASAPASAPAGNKPAGNTPKVIAKGDTMKAKDGKEYKWMGALWVDTATNKPIGIIPSMQQGLPNPKLDPIIAAAKKDPAMAKLIKQQVTSKGVEPGTAGAQKAAQAGVKGTEPLDAKGVGA